MSAPNRPALTDEQRKRVEANRKRALERLQQKNGGTKPQETTSNSLNKNQNQEPPKKKFQFQPPPIRKSDYIEFDFSTMKDTKGGFILDETHKRGDEQSFDDWKKKQQVRDMPPPMDLSQMSRCFECQSIDIDKNLYNNFNVRACRKCAKEKSEKYSLLTKTEAKEDYLLTEPELADTSLLPRIEKPNPHGYSKMQLFVRFQVEEFAWKKWGGPEQLDLEWERREQNKVKRKEKKYQEQLREMRKKTRAEEFTRKLRDGKSLGEKHEHDWAAPIKVDSHTIKRRCIDCGIETEEVVI
ncbi:DNA repair protein RAD14 [Candida maltosa Xu316]|uniref:DNA repair protein RAD14 n=1 Tax=Candida maltosa (strain Xu316) TaxID=1245528 RepID=M3IHB7_CANMX|nr:DNA repair protein RAD14 [Candida maltosa Xu316]